ncbi:response regulator transcription factor [Nocardia wallacei]|uniref:response regulator transcription factor n=1 Tax=Nocardia wallacei TaxID=480035 RepID=UPI002453C88E|nr:response regulator transcription factor [Nocardia wallacei]
MVVDDDGIVRTGLRMILESAEDIAVVAEAEDGRAAVEAVRQHFPAVVLMDIRMPGLDGVKALEQIRRLPKPPNVIMLTTFDGDEYVESALRMGAAGFLLKDIAPRDLISAVRSVAKGGGTLAPSVTRRLIETFAAHNSPRVHTARQRLSVLTDSERLVVSAVARGLSNAQIARELEVSEATVKAHISRTLTKLGFTNRVQIALLVRDATG